MGSATDRDLTGRMMCHQVERPSTRVGAQTRRGQSRHQTLKLGSSTLLFAKTFGTFPREYSPLTLRGGINCFAASEIYCEAADRGHSLA